MESSVGGREIRAVNRRPGEFTGFSRRRDDLGAVLRYCIRGTSLVHCYAAASVARLENYEAPFASSAFSFPHPVALVSDEQ